MSQIINNTEKAAKHFLDLYKEDLTNADEQVAKNTIHEWWGQTEDQYPGAEYEDVESAILSKL